MQLYYICISIKCQTENLSKSKKHAKEENLDVSLVSMFGNLRWQSGHSMAVCDVREQTKVRVTRDSRFYWQFKLAMRDLVVDKRTNQYGYRWASRSIVYTILKPDAHSVTQ